MQLQADISLQGYYLKTEAQRHAAFIYKGTRLQSRDYTETRHYSSDLVYLVYIQAGVPCGCRGFSSGLTVGISWRGLRCCRVGVAMMTIPGIVGHNPVGACSQKATKHFWGHQGVLVADWGRPQGLDRLSEQHDWVVGVGFIFSSFGGSAYQFSTSCD